MVQRTQREMPGADGPRDEPGSSKGALKVSSCQAFDYILLAALRAQVGCQRRLCLQCLLGSTCMYPHPANTRMLLPGLLQRLWTAGLQRKAVGGDRRVGVAAAGICLPLWRAQQLRGDEPPALGAAAGRRERQPGLL